MLGAAESGGSLWHRVGNALVHAHPIIITIVPTAIIVHEMAETTLTIVLVTAALWLAVLAVFAQRSHERRLCERCAAATPLNPDVAVVRHDLALRVSHYTTTSAYFLGWLVLAIITTAATVTSSSAWGVALLVPLYLLWAVEVAALQRHRSLQPWCPYCRRGGGGDENAPETPTSTLDGTRTR
jgi:hypothetical protein